MGRIEKGELLEEMEKGSGVDVEDFADGDASGEDIPNLELAEPEEESPAKPKPSAEEKAEMAKKLAGNAQAALEAHRAKKAAEEGY